MHSNTRQALNASTRSVYAKWYWVNHGRLTSQRQAHQRTQSLPSATHRHSSITRPCCSGAQAPSFLSFTRAHQRTIMHSNTRQAANNHALEHSTGSERVDAFGLREMVLGKSRQAHQPTAGSPANGRLTSECKAYLPLPIVTHQSLDPAARALKRQASCLLRVDAFATRRRGNHMHDHSRFQRDIDWRHRRLSLSLSLTKVTHAQYRKRFRVSYNKLVVYHYLPYSNLVTRPFLSLEPSPTLVDMVTTGSKSRRHHINKGWAWFEATRSLARFLVT